MDANIWVRKIFFNFNFTFKHLNNLGAFFQRFLHYLLILMFIRTKSLIFSVIEFLNLRI